MTMFRILADARDTGEFAFYRARRAIACPQRLAPHHADKHPHLECP